jgi:hypothetical protein
MLTQSVTWTPEKIAESDARHALTDQAGLCHAFELPVADGAANHGSTGADGECHRSPLEQVSQQIQEVNFVDPTDTHPRMARVTGSQLVHLVIPVTGTALCGYKPRNARHMRRRGKWLYWRLDAAVTDHMSLCAKCTGQARADYPPLEDESHKVES